MLWSSVALAGGGPANVAVLFNADDSDSEDIAAYYADQRSLPLGHVCGVEGIEPGTLAMPFADYLTTVGAAVDTCLDALPQPDEIDYVVIARGLPYRVDLADGGYSTSLSAMVQIHHAMAGSSELAGQPQERQDSFHKASVDNPVYVRGTSGASDFDITNPYSGWYQGATKVVRSAEQPLAFTRATAGSAGGIDFSGNLFIVHRLDGFDADDARALVDRAVAADGSFPTAELLCMASADEPRGARDPECEFVARSLDAAGLAGTWLGTHDSALEGHEVAAYFTGAANLRGAIDGQTYVPGAIACNLTSYGAVPQNFVCDGETCPASESQSTLR